MRLRSLAILLPGLLAPTAAPAAVFTVGGDAACTHGNLLSAIGAASANGAGLDEIRLATNLAYNAIIAPVASHSLTIRGGYSSCSDTTASGRTIVRGTTAGASGTFATSGTAAPYELNLENLELREGSSATRRGGALRIEGRFTVRLRNTLVTDNFAARGGGVYIDGSADALLDIDAASVVSNNVAGVSGGGIYCQANGAIELRGLVLANTAQDGASDPNESGNGGGVALYGCFMNQDESPGFRGVLANTAARHGGGYYLRGGSDLFATGDGNDPAKITDNIAGDTGGALAVNDPLAPASPSNANVANGWIERNRAPTGAGVGVIAGGTVTIGRTLNGTACHDATYCSSLSLNEQPAGSSPFSGCAGFVGEGGVLRVRKTRVEENCETQPGTAFLVARSGVLRVDSSVVANNGNRDPFWIDDLFTGELQISWSTITGHYETTERGMFAVPRDGISSGTLRVYGTILGEPFLQLTSVRGIGGQPPMTFDFDCLVLDSVSTQPLAPIRGIRMAAPYGMIAPAAGNFRLASGNALPVDWCDASRAGRVGGDADGVTTIYDAPRANQFGPYDLGAYEFVVASQPDPLFANGFE